MLRIADELCLVHVVGLVAGALQVQTIGPPVAFSKAGTPETLTQLTSVNAKTSAVVQPMVQPTRGAFSFARWRLRAHVDCRTLARLSFLIPF